MLKLTDLVFAKGPKGETLSKTYQKVYFSHTSGDKTKEITKTFDGKEAGRAIVPDGVSAASLDTLYNEMLDYVTANHSGDPNNPTDARATIMALTEKGLDLSTRAAEGSALRPKDVDVNKVIERNAKGMVALGIYKSFDEAVAAIKASMAAVTA